MEVNENSGNGLNPFRFYMYFHSFHRYDHPHILSGQGTMGLEIVEQVPDLDACIIPVGGGGLIAGSALAIKSLRPNVMIIVGTIMILSFWRDRSG